MDPSLLHRTVSTLVSSYPINRGKFRLRKITSPWLVGKLPYGSWVRCSGVVDAEWNFLQGSGKEEITSNFVRAFLSPGSIFVDVGANIGYFTLLAGKLGARVVAYEPTPSVFTRLKENIALNAVRAELVHAAVMDRAMTLPLYHSADDPEANNLFGEGHSPVLVPAVSLDDDLHARGIDHVDLLKIDAEGAEPFVLDGAKRLLSSPNPPVIILEVNPVSLKNSGHTPSDIYRRLESLGYRCNIIEQLPYKGLTCTNILAIRTAVIERRSHQQSHPLLEKIPA